jgi:hypothetical protein
MSSSTSWPHYHRGRPANECPAGGLDPERRRLFVIDGSQALRTAIDQVFGSDTPMQRCRNHKVRNVVGRLPQGEHEQSKATLWASFKLDA